MRAPLAAAWVVFASLAGGPATAADFTHVRSAQPDVRALLADGYDRSPTFQALVDQIDSLQGIVYIERSIALSDTRAGALLLSAAGSPDWPILRVQIRATLAGDYRIANLAHELQHVVEVLRARATTPEAMSSLFASLATRVGHPGSVYETAAAQDVTAQVLKELRRGNRHAVDRDTRTATSSTNRRNTSQR
jgi:hypothetical protein